MLYGFLIFTAAKVEVRGNVRLMESTFADSYSFLEWTLRPSPGVRSRAAGEQSPAQRNHVKASRISMYNDFQDRYGYEGR